MVHVLRANGWHWEFWLIVRLRSPTVDGHSSIPAMAAAFSRLRSHAVEGATPPHWGEARAIATNRLNVNSWFRQP